MPWDPVMLNVGRSIPTIAFGTWKLGNGQGAVDQALLLGLVHVDTAQGYSSEEEAGQTLKESGLGRSDVFVTTKWSGRFGQESGYFVCGFIPRSFPTPRRTGHPDSMGADGTSFTRRACEEHRHKQLQH